MRSDKSPGSARPVVLGLLSRYALAILGAALIGVGVLVALMMVQTDGVTLTGDLGLEPRVIRALPEGSEVDARTALFRVANSANPFPTADKPCDKGDLPVNPYPLQVRDSPGFTLRGGLFSGAVPLESDWEDTYCNSAGILLRDGIDGSIEAPRLRRVWDAIRITEGTSGFHLRGAWISEVRDDCIENDYLNGGLVEDSLLDGCFSGLSMRAPDGEERLATGGPFVLRGVLMRMQSYLYKAELHEGPPLKVDESQAEIEVYDSILVMEDRSPVSQSRLSIGWSRIGKCSGNLLLWTADTPWPRKFTPPPDCFQIVEGEEARALWQKARRNWIDCHPLTQRFEDDPISDTTACDPAAPGGPSAESSQ